MADTLKFQGEIYVIPTLGLPVSSGCPTIDLPYDETVQLANSLVQPIDLDVDTPVAIPFGTLTNAHVVSITSNKKVTVRLTSADGATQSVPVDGTLVLISETVPITAIDLTRVAGATTRVKVFLGEKN